LNNQDIERIAKSAASSEMAEELGEFRSQLSQIGATINQLQTKGADGMSSEMGKQNQEQFTQLLDQFQQFSNRAQEQQLAADQNLQQSLQQAVHSVNDALQYVQSNRALSQMNHAINQAQQQLMQTSAQQGQQEAINQAEQQLMQLSNQQAAVAQSTAEKQVSEETSS